MNGMMMPPNGQQMQPMPQQPQQGGVDIAALIAAGIIRPEQAAAMQQGGQMQGMQKPTLADILKNGGQ